MIIIAIEDGVFQGAWHSKAGADTDVVLLDMDEVETGADGIGLYTLGDANDMEEGYKEVLNDDLWFFKVNGGKL